MFLLSKPGQASLSAHGADSLKMADPVVGNELPPSFALADLTVHQSDCFAGNGFYIRVCDLPPCRHFFTIECSSNAYQIRYRPRPEIGRARTIIPPLGMPGRPDERNCLLLIPPRVRVQTEWTNAAGRVGMFFLAPDLIQNFVNKINIPMPSLGRSELVSMDQRLELLCRLLMEETEDGCPQGSRYLEALAQAMVISLLHQVSDPQIRTQRRVSAIPMGIEAAIQKLEKEFWEPFSVADLAETANLSAYHFARTFKKVTGLTPHRYLLQVRLRRAREMMLRQALPISLGKIAVACGFADQTHFGRHFRRCFGMTPKIFLQAQSGLESRERSSRKMFPNF